MEYCYRIDSLPSGVYQIHGSGSDEPSDGSIFILKNGLAHFTGNLEKTVSVKDVKKELSPYSLLQKIL